MRINSAKKKVDVSTFCVIIKYRRRDINMSTSVIQFKDAVRMMFVLEGFVAKHRTTSGLFLSPSFMSDLEFECDPELPVRISKVAYESLLCLMLSSVPDGQEITNFSSYMKYDDEVAEHADKMTGETMKWVRAQLMGLMGNNISRFTKAILKTSRSTITLENVRMLSYLPTIITDYVRETVYSSLRRTSDFVGTPSSYEILEDTFVTSQFFIRGDHYSSWLFKMVSGDNAFMWFSSGSVQKLHAGKHYKLKVKVKRHSTDKYVKGMKVTQVTHVKILEELHD